MERVTPETASQAFRNESTQTPSGSLQQSAQPTASMMATLWLRMAQIYANRWTAPHGESPDAPGSSAETWAKGLAGITGKQLADGLKACVTRTDEWPPTLPAFRAMCLGIPPLSAIRRELASEDADRGGFAVLVWSKLDGFSFRRAEGKAADRMLAEAYDEAREYVMQGGEIPPPRVAIAPPKPEPIKPASPESVAAAVAEMRKLFNKGDAE